MNTNPIPTASSFLSRIKRPEDLFRAVWKRKLWFIAALALGGMAAFGYIKMVPPAYQASTMILVESQKIPTDYIRPTVTTSLNERLRTIEQQIKNRGNLERLVMDMDLYPELRESKGMGYALKLVRRNLELRVLGDQIFEIYFSGGDPNTVAATANRVAEVFIDENLRRRASEAENTTSFLAEELEATKRLLEEQEQKVSEYRIRHAGELPEDRQANMQAVDQLETQLDIAQEEIRSTELQILMRSREVPYSAPPTDLDANNQSRSRLEKAREELQRLSAQYTDLHPDVIRLRREVELLEAREAAKSTELDTSGALSVEPVGRDSDAMEASLEAELTLLKRKRDETLAELSVYRRRLETIPRVEQELVQLTRDYENLQNSYQSLLGKRIEARLSENLERKRQSEQFRILEPAVPPTVPYAPNKLQTMLLGLVAGGAIGVGLILLREGTDQTFKDADSLRIAFPNVRFLGSIHRMNERELEADSSRVAERSA